MSETPHNKDQALWETAKRRVGFRSHLLTYIIVNIFLWILWFFSHNSKNPNDTFPWPLLTTLGWGLGVAFHFARTYVYHPENAIELELCIPRKQQLLR